MKQTIYFAIYINVGGMASMKARETVAQFINMYKPDKMAQLKNQYEEKYFFFPVRTGETRIEVVYPTPFMSVEDADKLYAKYYENFKNLIQQIKDEKL